MIWFVAVASGQPSRSSKAQVLKRDVISEVLEAKYRI